MPSACQTVLSKYGPTFCGVLFGSKLFAEVYQQTTMLAGKELWEGISYVIVFTFDIYHSYFSFKSTV